MNLSIKNAPVDLIHKLEQRARENKRSLDGEVLSILESAVVAPRASSLGPSDLLREIRKLGIATPSDSVAMIREDRDR